MKQTKLICVYFLSHLYFDLPHLILTCFFHCIESFKSELSFPERAPFTLIFPYRCYICRQCLIGWFNTLTGKMQMGADVSECWWACAPLPPRPGAAGRRGNSLWLLRLCYGATWLTRAVSGVEVVWEPFAGIMLPWLRLSFPLWE